VLYSEHGISCPIYHYSLTVLIKPSFHSGTGCSWNRTPPNQSVLHHETSLSPSPAVPHRPYPFPAVPNRPRPSSPIPCCPPPSPTVPHSPYLLPCTNMSHPVGPAVLPKDGRPPLKAPRTDYSQPSRPVRGSWQTPGRLRTLPCSSLTDALASLLRSKAFICIIPVDIF